MLARGRYTLLEQDALEFLSFCHKKGISVIIGTPFGGRGGILSADSLEGAKYWRQEPTPEILTRVRQMRQVCRKYNVPLKAAALQFVLAHPAVAAVIPGTSSQAHVEENFLMVQHHIPRILWKELKEKDLIPIEAPIPD